MKCPKCFKGLVKGAKFCPECGAPAPIKIETPKAETEQRSSVFLTLNEIAKVLKTSRSNIYTLINEEDLPWFPLGRDKRFILEEVIQWGKNRQVRGKAV